MKFEWDEEKNRSNIKKHGISFVEAQEVFDDAMHISKLDQRFEYFEERWFTIGKVKSRKIVVVAHTYFDASSEPIIRIISARFATNSEGKIYEEQRF